MRLARNFLAFFARAAGRCLPELSPAAEQVLLSYTWPGNVRELRNTMERVLILWPARRIESQAFPGRMWSAAPASLSLGGDVPLAQIERQHVLQVLARDEQRRGRPNSRHRRSGANANSSKRASRILPSDNDSRSRFVIRLLILLFRNFHYTIDYRGVDATPSKPRSSSQQAWPMLTTSLLPSTVAPLPPQVSTAACRTNAAVCGKPIGGR